MNMEFFTKKTILEIIPILSNDQLNTECSRHLKASKQGESSQRSPEAKRKYLLNKADKLKDGVHVEGIIDSAVTNACDGLVEKLSEDLVKNAKLLDALQNKLDAFTITNTIIPDPVCILDNISFNSYGVNDVLDNCLADYSNVGQREVAYYGSLPYSYTGKAHPPASFPKKPIFDAIFNEMKSVDPAFNRDTYTCVSTLYKNGASFIPPHSDLEPSIVPNSDIYCANFGATRILRFTLIADKSVVKEYTLENGSVYRMTAESQKYWLHSIPPTHDDIGPRVSLTFRKLMFDFLSPLMKSLNELKSLVQNKQNVNNDCRIVDNSEDDSLCDLTLPLFNDDDYMEESHDVQSYDTDQRHGGSCRVLILSDSRNLSVDKELLISKFGNATIEVKPMYHIKHITNHEKDIANSDIVLVSSGVNDIVKWYANGDDVADFLIEQINKFQVKFPKIRFLFGSINPTNVDCPMNEAFNRHIDMINIRMFKFSLTTRNMRLFDNTNFEWRHLTPDGIHLTHTGRKSLSMSWIAAVRNAIGLDGVRLLPIRPQYRDLYNRFYHR